MIPQPFKTLWESPTFTNLIRTLPTVLTSSLFMLFGLLEMVLICLKWMLFVLIIAATFLFGLGLLMGFVLVLVGVLMGMAEEGGGDEVRENAEQDVHAEQKVEQEEAVLDLDVEERATQSPPKSVVLDTSSVEETENDLEEYWTKPSEEMGEDYERDALQRLRRHAHEDLAAVISPSPSPERRTLE